MGRFEDATAALRSLADSVDSRLDKDRERDLSPSPGPYRAYDNAESPLMYAEVTAGVLTDVAISDEALGIYSPQELSLSLTMTIGLAYDMFYADNEVGDDDDA